MAATRHVTESFNSKGASLSEEGGLVNIRFHTSTKLEPTIIDTIDCLTRHLVAKNARIETLTVKSLASAERSFRHWRVDPELGLSGKIRVVNIAGIDANPCGGSHVKSTDEIGPFAIKGYRAEGAGTYTIEAARVPVWMDWYDDEFLARSALVDLRVFEP
jgi:Ser-tRNA(Ala) deacylase AlaX